MIRRGILLGTSGNAYDVIDTIEAINTISDTWIIDGYLDDHKEPGTLHLGYPVLGKLCDCASYIDHQFMNAIGSEKSYLLRPDIVSRTGLARDRFATLVHPRAAVSSHTQIGHGVHINSNVTIGAGVVVGDHVTFGPGCIVGHDTVIEEYSIIAPGAILSGFVRVGRNSYIGAGAMIRQCLTIGEGCLIGMGAVVVRDVKDAEIVVGNPAGPIRRN